MGKISWKMLIASVFGLILAWAVYHFFSLAQANASSLYKHPFTVSNNVLSIQQELEHSELRLHQLMSVVTGLDNSRLLATIEQLAISQSLIDQRFSIVRKEFLGDPNMVFSAESLYQRWLATQRDIVEQIAQGQLDSARKTLIFELDSTTLKTNEELNKLLRFAQNKALEFQTEAKLNYEYAAIFMVLFIVYIIFLLKRAYSLSLAHIKQHYKELEDHTNWRSSILNATPESIIIVDENANIVECNERACIFFGYTRNELLGLRIHDLVPFEAKDRHATLFKNWIKNPQGRRLERSLTVQARTFEGRVINVAVQLSFTQSGCKTFAIAAIRDLTKELEATRKLEHQANYDSLTGLPNRFHATSRFNEAQKLADKHSRNLAVLFLDLDDFKRVNDTFGHETGDNLLQKVSRRLTGTLKDGDFIARHGGDEFILVLPFDHDIDTIHNHVHHMVEQFKRPFEVEEKSILIGACVGISIYPVNGKSFSELLRKADAALYHAKARGHNQFSLYFDSLTLGLSRYFEIEEAIVNANIEKEFYLVFQPQIDFKAKRVMGAEALIRWNSSKVANVSPQDFIPVAENNGIIFELGRFIIKEALSFASTIIHKFDLPNFKISINLSPNQFHDVQLIEGILHELKSKEVEPSNLVLEITEGLLLESSKEVEQLMNKITKTGMTISMDDFGTGYSSLSYLRQFPFNHIKLDKSFIDDLVDKPECEALVGSSIELAHALNMKVVAEGIESKEQAEKLCALKCDFQQGFYFSKPLLPEDFKRFLKEFGAIASSDENVVDLRKNKKG